MLKRFGVVAIMAFMTAGVIGSNASAGPVPATSFFSGFEEDVGLSNGQWTIVPTIEGWKRTHGPGIEVQNGLIGEALPYDGKQKIELDSGILDDDFPTANSGMEQTVTLAAGAYEFSFAYLGRTSDAGTNGIGYSISPKILKDDVTGVNSDGWMIISHLFELKEDTDVTMSFWAQGTDDWRGGYIDNVRISAVPLPPAVLLFGAALAGLGWVGRRRKTGLK